MSFHIRLEPSGRLFSCGPDETILDAAMRQRVRLLYGCRTGQCGTCLSRLSSGSLSYPSGRTAALEGQGADACLVCQAVPTSDLVLEAREIATPADIEVKLLPCRVERIDHLSHDVIRLWLKLPETQRLVFLAGQYLEFLLSDGRRRAFSMANPPYADQLIELHIRLVPGGVFTDYVFHQMKEKAVLRLQGPFGTFFLREDSPRPMILVGGGTGFAPLKAMIEQVLHQGLQRPMHLYWGVRAQRDLYLPDLPERWAAANPDFRYTPVLSEADPDWAGRRGWVHQAVVDDYPQLDDYDIYMSGPPVMIQAAKQSFLDQGLPLEHLYSDAFEYAADGKTSGAPT